ncbi:MAG: 4-hydroxythreonine-4-phosphate dehydrogenase PdxA [Cyanobacteria bacterium P01_A01_bin.84]
MAQTNLAKTNSTKIPHLAIAMGDPGGIASEVILKALADPEIIKGCDITVVGSRKLLEEIYDKLSFCLDSTNLANPKDLSILDLHLSQEIESKIILGKGNAASGEASFKYLTTAIEKTLKGEFDGIVTGPIAKSAWKAAGYNYPGQTELLAEKAGVEKFGMLFVARSPHSGFILRSLLATTHIPLSQVPTVLTSELMTKKLELLLECLEQDFGITEPTIAIAGLNPHSGEQGQLGTEEQDWLSAWLDEQTKRYPKVKFQGLIPPDTMWVKPGQAWYGSIEPKQAADAYLALYHDQGLIPVKLMAFDRAVNTSIGLPFVRTSPDHGTAFDIALKGIADATSMKAAIELGVELTMQRKGDG